MADRIVTATMAHRTPNWNKWRLIPNPELWQCVALSLNIDPDKVRRGSRYRLHPDRIINESQEFQDRLEMACANIGKDGALRPTHYGAYPLHSYYVSLREFAAWVQKIGWEAPAELLGMADQEAAPCELFTHQAESGGPSTVAAERRCQEWLVKLMRIGRPTKTKSDYLNEAKEKFRVSGRAFVRAWANAITETGATGWSKPGPN